MDVERTMEFLLQQAARTEAGLAKTEAGLAKTEAGLAKTEAGLAKTEKGLAKTEALLRRAIRAGVQEARAERRKREELRQDFENKMAELHAAQAATDASLRAFIDSLRRGGNGHA